MIPLAVAAVALLLHLATAWRYGYFRDELYFIACGHHLSWGYVDQPPLVAVVAWLAQPAHDSLIALRLPVLLAAALTVWLGAAIARDLGGGRFAQALAATGVALLPAYLALGNILTTTSFEPLSWTLLVWCTIRITRGADATRWWLAAAASAAFGLYGKYSIALLAFALFAGLLLTRERRVLRTPMFPLAVVLALLAIAPNLLWQAAHGWPFFDVLQSDAVHRPAFNNGWRLESRNIATNAGSFALEQLLYTGACALLWIAGLLAPFFAPRLTNVRWLSVAYLVLFVAAVLLGAKGYYVIGIYAPLLACGAVAVERAATPLRAAVLALVVLTGIVALPLSVPLLPVDALIAYSQRLGLTGTNGTTPHLIQPLFAEEFGWKRLARDVARVYDALPNGTRGKTAIYADTYADAGAIDRFGGAFGLPHAISTQNQYDLWGTRGYDGKTLIAIGATRIALLRAFYQRCDLAATSDEPLKWVVEGPAPIYLCSGPRMPLDRIWPHLRWFGA
jgi:hypothetical protein